MVLVACHGGTLAGGMARRVCCVPTQIRVSVAYFGVASRLAPTIIIIRRGIEVLLGSGALLTRKTSHKYFTLDSSENGTGLHPNACHPFLPLSARINYLTGNWRASPNIVTRSGQNIDGNVRHIYDPALKIILVPLILLFL
jgi:hypothetical protein